jgi:hypothetical protein
MTFYVSPTTVSKFFDCPAAYEYGTKFWYNGPEDPNFAFGTWVHSMLETGDIPEPETEGMRLVEPTEITVARRIRNRVNMAGYEIIDGEILEGVDLGDDVIMRRKIDAYALLNGKPVLIDYKTSKDKWFSLRGVVPQAIGIQAEAYLIPPTNPDNNPFQHLNLPWPEEIHFIVGKKNKSQDPSDVEIYGHRTTPEGRRNLYSAIHIIKQTEVYPKLLGYKCKSCPWVYKCLGTDRADDPDLYNPKKEKTNE